MATAARLPLAADRYTSCVRTFRFRGLDLTGLVLRLQVRLLPDTPGAPEVDLGIVTNGNEQGLRILPVEFVDGVPVTPVLMRINETTMEGLPYDGERGASTVLAYDLIAVFGIDKRRLAFGEFRVIPGVTGADNAPAVREAGDKSASDAQPWSVAELTFNGDVVQITIDGFDLLRNTVGSVIGASEARSADLVQQTRDPWRALQDKFTKLLFGTSVYVNGYPTTTRATFNIPIFGDSLGVSQGASGSNTLQSQITAIFADLVPELVLDIRLYARPGSWQAQMSEQIDEMVEDGFVPDMPLIVTGTNDGSTSIFHSLEGPVVFARELAKNIKRLQDMGAVVGVVSKPPVHPTQSLIAGRFDFSPDFFPTVPSTGFVAGDDDFQTLTYSASAQTISSNIPGQFKLYANGWFAPDQWFRVKEGVFGPDPLFCHVVSWDGPGTVLTVDDGNGGPVIPYDVVTRKGGWQARINARTQLVPARNENNLSRPAGIASNVLLSVEPRDLNGNGVLINASLRHLVIERVTDEVTAQMAAIRVPWGEEFKKELTSNASYDALYLKNDGTAIDEYHPNNVGYALFGQAFRPVLARAIFGVWIGG